MKAEWFVFEEKEERLYQEQIKNLPLLKEKLNHLGYDIIKQYRDYSGWLDGFRYDWFIVCDRRDKTKSKMHGSNNNDALYLECNGGGYGLFTKL